MDGMDRRLAVGATWAGVLAVAALTAGCSTLAMRPAVPADPNSDRGFVYENGEGRMSYPLGISVVEDAMLEALQGQYRETHVEAASDGSTRIESRSGLARKATVLLRPIEGGTQATVRIGPLADAEQSRKLLDRVAGRTGLLIVPNDEAVKPAAAQMLIDGSASPDAVLQRERGGMADSMGYAP